MPKSVHPRGGLQEPSPLSEGALEHLREALHQLHTAYSGGRLRILAGAGLSQTSDLPGWEALNRGLLARALLALHEVLAHQPDVLEDLVERLYQRVGRDAAAEFVLGAFRSTHDNSDDWFDRKPTRSWSSSST